MKTSSAKAKGRGLQQLACELLLTIGSKFGLEFDDVLSRGMGQNGVDVMLSPAARKVFGNLAIECKCVEALNVVTVFWEHAEKYKEHLSLLIHRKNRTDALITMKFSDFLVMFDRSLAK